MIIMISMITFTVKGGDESEESVFVARHRSRPLEGV